jgi:hypothetical protein
MAEEGDDGWMLRLRVDLVPRGLGRDHLDPDWHPDVLHRRPGDHGSAVLMTSALGH